VLYIRRESSLGARFLGLHGTASVGTSING
jgi:hypothetical protein